MKIKISNKLKLNNKGFTITELIIAFLITTIIIVACSTILFSSSSYFNAVGNTSKDKLFADNTMDMLQEQLAYAVNIQLLASGSTQTPMYNHIFTVQSNRLYLNNNDIYGNDIYGSRKFELQLSPQANGILTITINIKDAASIQTYTTTETFKINTMAALSTAFNGITTGTLTNPIISYKKNSD